MKRLIYLLAALLFSELNFAQTGWFDTQAGIIQNEHGKICLTDANHVFVITDHGNFHKTADGGTNWQVINIGIDTIFFDIDFYNNNFGVVAGANGTLLVTHNGGNNWTTINTGTTEDLMAVDIINSNSIYCVGKQGVILSSNDAGNSWTLMDTITSNNLYDVQFKDDLTGYIVGDEKILKTTDGGNHWTEPITDYSSMYYTTFFSLSITETKLRLVQGPVYRNGWVISVSTDEAQSWVPEYELPMCTSVYISSISYENDSFGYIIETGNPNSPMGLIRSNPDIYLSINSISPNAANTACFGEDIAYFLDENVVWKTIDGGTNSLADYTKDIVKIYPNPTQQYLNIQSEIDITNVLITDISGKQIFSTDKKTINIQNLKEGIYIAIVFLNNEQKVIKEFIVE